jgi:hypothetical protein
VLLADSHAPQVGGAYPEEIAGPHLESQLARRIGLADQERQQPRVFCVLVPPRLVCVLEAGLALLADAEVL